MEKRKYPRIFLAIDNCFASKRWTEPDAWAAVISELGIHYIEASADTELDPLYMGRAYLPDWVQKVKRAEETYQVKVANLYSGHGTYSTLGLAHTDPGVRKNMAENWFKPMIDTAAALGAGMGFFAHAFSEAVMKDPESYEEHCGILTEALGELCLYGAEKGCGRLAVEQMYVPHQIPWTIGGTAGLLREVKRISGRDFYFTEDVGHHHMKFVRPDREQIKRAFEEEESSLWLGSGNACRRYDEARKKGEITDSDLLEIEELAKKEDRFFAGREDGDCYAWLSHLGRYSPIIHLQQTDGRSSAHKPFTETENKKGIIRGDRVLKALKQSYDRESETEMPAPCEDICLTLELFSGTTQTPGEILKNYRETVRYWRQFVPEDGLYLDELVSEKGMVGK